MNIMKKVLLLVVLGAVLAGCGADKQVQEAAPAGQTQGGAPTLAYLKANQVKVPLEKGKWKLGYSAKKENSEIFEFVANGESPENWTEMVTVQRFVDLKKTKTLKQCGDSFLNKITSDGKKGLQKSGIAVNQENLAAGYVKEEANNLLMYWHYKGISGENDQMELVRWFTTDESNDIYAVHYAIKNKVIKELTEEKRQLIGAVLNKTVLNQ